MDEAYNQITSYILGRVEQFIEDYARGRNLSAADLAQRVGAGLFAQAGGEVLGMPNRLPALRGGATQAHQGKRKSAQVDHRTHDPGTQIPALRKDQEFIEGHYSQHLGKQVWIRPYVRKKKPHDSGTLHWMQKPENKHRMMQAVRRMRKGYLLKYKNLRKGRLAK